MTATVPSRIHPTAERSIQPAAEIQQHSRRVNNRIAVLWFPDWPVQAALLEENRQSMSAESPAIALASNHRITACCDKARGHGVRRGMKLRAAQALCPSMLVRDTDPQRDGRLFCIP